MIKKVLLVVGGILLSLFGVVAFILWRLDPEELGQEVIRRVNDKGGMQLEAEAFSIEPLQGIFIDNAHLSGYAAAGRVSADVAKVIIEYELLPILKKELVIDRIIVEQPQAKLVSRPASESAPESEPSAAEPPAQETTGAAAASAEATTEADDGFQPSVAINEFRIENASLDVVTEETEGGKLAIQGLDLELGDFYIDSAATEPLLGLTARGGIRIEQITADDMTIQGGRGDVSIQDGQVAVRDIGVETANASLNVAKLDLDLRQEPPIYHLEAGGSFDLNSFVNSEGPGGFGPASVALTLNGAGPDPDGAIGEGGLRMEAGTVPAFPMIAKIEGLLGEPLITGNPYQVTDMDFTLANGVATIQPFDLVLENLQINGSGNVNLDGPLDLRISIKIPRELVHIELLDGMIDGMTDEEGWTVIPFTVRGTTGDPEVAIDMSAAKAYAKGAAKDAVGGMVDSAVESVKEKTRSRFNGDKDDG